MPLVTNTEGDGCTVTEQSAIGAMRGYAVTGQQIPTRFDGSAAEIAISLLITASGIEASVPAHLLVRGDECSQSGEAASHGQPTRDQFLIAPSSWVRDKLLSCSASWPGKPIYKKTKNFRAVQLLLGNKKLECTVRCLSIEVDDSLEMAEQTEV